MSTKARARTGVLPYLAASIPLRLAGAGTAVAIPVLAIEELNSIATGGLLVGLSLAPTVLVAPFAGAALDRAPNPRLLFTAAGLVTAVAFALTAFLGVVPLPVIVAVLILSGAAAPFYMGGLSGVVGDIVIDDRRAFAQDALSYNIAGVAGPGLAAVGVGLGSGRIAMLTLAALAATGAIAMLWLPISRRVRHEDAHGLLREIGEGFRALATHRPLALVTAAGTVSQFGAGAFPIAAVALAIERNGSSDGGAVLVTAFAVGAVVGSIATASLTRFDFAPVRVMWFGFAGTGLALLAIIPDLGSVAAVAATAVAGLLSAPATAAMLLLRARYAPPGLRSQVFAVAAGLRASAAALGAALIGVIAGVPAWALIVFVAAGWLLSTLFLVRFPADDRAQD